MTQERTLPKKKNPLLAAERTPEHSDLISRRRLGQTNLAVKPGQVGTSNATKPENLGWIDYAHLRAPLPENLKSSEIFAPQSKQSHPEAYFLMRDKQRRSSDGHVSATGMFKVSFPWAKTAEEQAERDYLKSLPTTSQDEMAGNVWIPESFALELAEEYGIVPWIVALLDESPVEATDDKKSISPPPKFVFGANHDRASLPPPDKTPARGRGRPRALSPSKSAPHAKLASPRKVRTTKASKEANAASAREASASLQAALDTAASRTETESVDGEKADGEMVNGEVVGGEGNVTVEVDSTIEINGDTEITNTKVRVEMPVGSPDLPLPESTEEMIAKAKEMVAEARKLEGESSSANKRKAEELDDEEDEEKDSILQPAKKARLLEQELKKQRVRKRALIGVAATLAIGAVVPYLIGG
ncbi:hypothetical protein MMC19_003428 [Ptychographa xylographoides]|nr:hypothetical protein [Ptychographa xylographoides]